MIRHMMVACAVLMQCTCASTPATAVEQHPVEAGRTVITNVTVVMPGDGRLLPNYAVVLRDSLIDEVAPMSQLSIAPGGQTIDGGGRYLMAGLIDMHVHLKRQDLMSYLSYGVTRVRNMWGLQGVLTMQAEISSGKLQGPAIHTLSPGFDASPGVWPFTQFVDDPSQADALVKQQHDLGYRIIKVYNSLSLASYDAIVAAAHKYGMSIAGHVPKAVPVEHALDVGQTTIEHMSGYNVAIGWWSNPDMSRLAALIEMTRKKGTWVCPTLAIQAKNNETSVMTKNRGRAARMFFEGHVPILIGTDAGIGVTQPGEGMRQEFLQFSAAGFSAGEILTIATEKAALQLGLEDHAGVVRNGAVADLLLLDSNPFRDATAATRPAVVIAAGKIVVDVRGQSPSRLDR